MTDNQKRYLGFGAVTVVGFLVWRHMHSTGTVATGGPALTNLTPQGSIQNYTPQSPLLIPSGESVYDPNNEALLNTPGALGPQATNQAAPAYLVNVNYPKTHRRIRNRTKPTKRPHTGGTRRAVRVTKTHVGRATARKGP